MDDDRHVADCISLVADNYEILTALAAREWDSLSELAERTDRSKSTVSRAANELQEAGLVSVREQDNRHRYALTFLGHQFADLLAVGQSLFEYSEMYSAVPADASLPQWVVSGGSVEVASRADPARHEVFDQILAFISRADRFEVVAPALTRDSTFHHLVDEVVSDGMAAELTFPESFLQKLRTRFPDQFPALVRDYDVETYAFSDDVDVPYGLGLGYAEAEDGTVVDAEMAVVCYDEYHHNGNGTVVNDSPEAVAWAERRYADYRERATPWNSRILDDDPGT